MDEPEPRRGLLGLPYDVHHIISGLVDAASRLSFVNCSKQARYLWMHAVFKSIRLQGTQTELVNTLALYLEDRSTLPVGYLRHDLKSLMIVVDAIPGFKQPEPITWRNALDLPTKHLLMEEALPSLILQVLRCSSNIEMLALDVENLDSDQSNSFKESLYELEGLPKVKHLRVAGHPLLTSTVISRCATYRDMVSLHLYSGIGSANVQSASTYQPSLKRLHLYVDTKVNVARLGTKDPDRINPTMRPDLLEEIARQFPTLEWLVLAPSCSDAPRPPNSRSEYRFFVKHVCLFALAVKRLPNLERIAFALPDAQIGNRIIRKTWDGWEPQATLSERRRWFNKLIRGFFSKAPQLQQVCVMTRSNEVFSGIRKGERVEYRRITAGVGAPFMFPFALVK